MENQSPAPAKLTWEYRDRHGDWVTTVSGRPDVRIRAVQDISPENPFESWDTNWPIVVRTPGGSRNRKFVDYPIDAVSHGVRSPLGRFNDEALVHNQVHIAKAMDIPLPEMFECYSADLDPAIAHPVKYCHDAVELRYVLGQVWDDGQVKDSDLFDVLVKLYEMLGIPAFTKTVRGYSQGDWAEVLVVATPEAQAKFGVRDPDVKDLEATADLYGWWAFGDVYGYVIEEADVPAEAIEDMDPDDVQWEEVSSCWGFYGPDHDKSGLEEAALEALGALTDFHDGFEKLVAEGIKERAA